jgi:5-formyltetrahydrofolate cyclo-ligase
VSGMDKGVLRREIQLLRDGIPDDEKGRLDYAISSNLLGWDLYQSADVIFCYVSFRSEIDTKPIIQQSLALNKTVSVPKIDRPSNTMRAFIIEDIETSLRPGYFGILEPVDHCRELTYADLQLVVAPGLAFTRNGERLGYGGGFYDRFIERNNQVPVCSLTYNRLILDKLPVKNHDLPVDYLITETGVMHTRRGAQ